MNLLAYTPLVSDFPIKASGAGNLANYINTIVIFAIGIAGILAVIMIIIGGVQYVSTDSWSGKDDGKKRIQAALGGLILALSCFLILNTIDPNLTNLTFDIKTIEGLSKEGGNISVYDPGYNMGGIYNEYQGPTQSGAPVSPIDGSQLSRIPVGSGGAHLTSYGYVGDLTPDRNSSNGIGNRDNRLTYGSVALSPDVIRSLSPKPGASIYVGGVFVGFYDDSTAESYNGKQLTNRVDIYDPSGSLGGNNFSRKTSGAITIDNTKIRTQVKIGSAQDKGLNTNSQPVSLPAGDPPLPPAPNN